MFIHSKTFLKSMLIPKLFFKSHPRCTFSASIMLRFTEVVKLIRAPIFQRKCDARQKGRPGTENCPKKKSSFFVSCRIQNGSFVRSDNKMTEAFIIESLTEYFCFFLKRKLVIIIYFLFFTPITFNF